MAAAYERLRFDHAVDAALAISGRGNQYLEETAPWTAFKKGDEQVLCRGCLPCCMGLLVQQRQGAEGAGQGADWEAMLLSTEGVCAAALTLPACLRSFALQRKADAAAVLAAVLEAVRVVAVLLSPVTPALSTRIYTQLGFSEQQAAALSWADTEWGTLRAGHATPQPQPVMQRLEGDFVTEPVPAAATAAPVGAKA